MSVQKVEIGSAVLYCGDSSEVSALIGNKTVDHVISDPPYEEAAHSEQRQVYSAGGGLKSGHLAFEAMTVDLRDVIAKEIVRVNKGWAMLFCQLEGWHEWRATLLKHGATPDHPMLWCKPDGKPRFDGTGPAPAYEVIELSWCGEGRRSWNGGGARGFFIENWSESREEGNTHQTIKPQTLMTKLVGLFTSRGETILDPFMGSGSTGVAAVALGRKFIGIEREPEYFDIGCKRIEKSLGGITASPYVKTKAQVTVPLFESAKKPPGPKAAQPKKRPESKLPKSTPRARFTMPTITASAPKPVTFKPRVPLVDPFAEILRDLPEDLPLESDAATWDDVKHGAVGMDVECFSNFFLVRFKDFASGKRIGFELSERSPEPDKRRLLDIIERECIITFNGTTYDMVMIALFLKGAGVNELKHYSNRLIGEHVKPWEIEREFQVKIPACNHVDLMEPNPSVRQSLKTLHGRLHGKIMMDLPCDPDAYLSRRQMNLTTLYCDNDVDAVQALFDALREPLRTRVAMGKKYGMDLRSKSDAQVGEAVLLERVRRITGRRVKKNYESKHHSFRYEIPTFARFETEQLNAVLNMLQSVEFHVGSYGVEPPAVLKETRISLGSSIYQMGIGGLHSTEGTRAAHSDELNILIDVDVAGHYGAMILKLGMNPPNIPQMQQAYGGMVKERNDNKRIANSKEEIEPSVRAEAKEGADGGKIANNGVFGKIMSIHGAISHPSMGVAVTIGGQLSVLMLIERAEARGISAISGNTDGVLFRCPRKLEPELMAMIKEWETETQFEVEVTRYKSIYNSSVNSYIAIKDDGKVKMKGPHANPWKEKDLRTMMMKNPQMTVLTEAVLGYIKEGKPFEETIRACTDPRDFVTVVNVKGGAKWRDQPIGKVVRYYWSTDSDPIVYANASRKVAKTDGARPLMVLPDELPNDVDYDKYVIAAEKLATDLAVIQGTGLLKEVQ